MDVKAYLKEEKKKIDRYLDRILFSDPACRGRALLEAMAYSVKAGGKRLRPILAVTSYRACGGPGGEDIYPAACALELIHTYTLIHDDLPVMDNDDYRRGLPTCHRKFGVRRATLAGVGLLLAAFETLGRSAESLGLSPDARKKVISSVAAATGGGGVVGGQVVDLESEGKEVSEETLNYIHSHKTGALIRVSCTLGGRLARAHEKKLAALDAYGGGIGLAFQIVDDLLDIEGDFKELGKGVGADQARGKATFPGRYGIEQSKRLAFAAVERAKAELARADIDSWEMLAEIADFILTRKS
ncbi:MAG TPA: farnesyl diphosphate synthase [archaeon]|nr:farnesyl diphosphate synthase [archaeon]